jgi:hypothetical protein
VYENTDTSAPIDQAGESQPESGKSPEDKDDKTEESKDAFITLEPAGNDTTQVSYSKTHTSETSTLPKQPNQGLKTNNRTPVDKQISLKKGMLRPHIHRYTLRIKIISFKTEEDEQALVQKTLQKFFNIVLQGDPRSIIPPFFELDRSDQSVPALSSTFNVTALDSYYSL